MKVRNSFYFVFCALSWGSSYLLIKLILNEIPPADIAMYRVLLGFLTTTAFIKSNKKVERKDHSLLLFLVAQNILHCVYSDKLPEDKCWEET